MIDSPLKMAGILMRMAIRDVYGGWKLRVNEVFLYALKSPLIYTSGHFQRCLLSLQCPYYIFLYL